MKFEIPGTKTHIRAFEPVKTVDEQYHIVDFGLEYEDGGIDSVAVGAATHTLDQLFKAVDEKKERDAKEAKASDTEDKDSKKS